MHIFYTPDIGTSNDYTLPKEESRHCIKVLRLKTGDPVSLIDGKGNLYHARLTDISPSACTVTITQTEKDYNKRQVYVHIAIAPTKNNSRFEWFLEKATEIGIDEITPVCCKRSERRALNTGRLEKIIIAAMKQAVITKKPLLNPPVEFHKFIQNTHKQTYEHFIAYCETNTVQTLKSLYKPGQPALILIGPEGDFTPEEVELATNHNFQPVSLGKNRLRTETAGIVACHSINLLGEK